MKKLGIIILIIAFLLSTFTLLPVKKALCNRPEECLLMEAWPWEFYHNPNGSNHNPGSSAVQNQPDNQKTIQQTAQPTIPPQDSNKQKNFQREKSFRDWLFKISLYLRMFLR